MVAPEPPSRRVWLPVVLLLALGAAAYFPVLHAGFVFDDDHFLRANPLIRSSSGLWAFWSTIRADDYWPVTSSTLWLEWRLWGANPAGYHLVNLVLHLGETVLLWTVLRRLRIPGAYLAALLFAVHPVNVESVAWIAQRKNLLAMAFFLLSVLWFWKAEEEGGGRGRWRWHGLSLLAFLLGMLSKSSVVMLPAVLVLLLWWRGRLSRRHGLILAPFFLVALALTAIEFWFQRSGALASVRSAGPVERFLGAGAVVWFYLGKALWPSALAFFYPAWKIRIAAPLWWLPVIALLSTTVVLWRLRCAWGRPVLAAWAYFCLMLVPAMGLTDVGYMKYSLVADHYQHLAMIAVVVAAAAGWNRWRERERGPFPLAAAGGVVSLLALLTFSQCREYRDAETLYRATLRRNPGAWVAHNNLGLILLDRGDTDGAIGHFEAALRIRPGDEEAHINLGNADLKIGLPAKAAGEYEAALAQPSGFAREAHLDLGNVRFAQGRESDAVAEYQAALRIDPAYSKAHYSLGNLLFRHGRYGDAVAEYRAALHASPDDPHALHNLKSALQAQAAITLR